MPKTLRAIIGQKPEPKATKVTLVRSPNAKLVQDDEGRWIEASTKATDVTNPEGDGENYKSSLKKDNSERPDGGYKQKLGEDEQIDEISKEKLGSYIKKANRDNRKNRKIMGQTYIPAINDDEDARTRFSKAARKADNRAFGVIDAIKKLHKK